MTQFHNPNPCGKILPGLLWMSFLVTAPLTTERAAAQVQPAQAIPIPMPARPLNFILKHVADFAVQEPMPPGAEQPATEAPVEVEITEPTPPARPSELRFHLWDGNVISGELSIGEISVVTEFGSLKIPVGKIVHIRPGLESFPERQTRIAQLVAGLGAPDFQEREAARRELVAMGRLLHQEIYRFSDEGNGERKRQLEEIRKEFEQQMDELASEEDLGDAAEVQPLIRKDQVATADFTIVGKIEPSSFQVASKYGPLTVQLADVRFADREQAGGLVRRATVTVVGNDFAGTSMKSTSLRLERGDRVSVRATGSLTMTPWGNQAVVTPEGNLSYGNFEGHGGGTLLARIGDSGEYIKLGSKATFTARKAGLLQLGVAVQADYAQQGYQFPGEYKVKLVVETNAAD